LERRENKKRGQIMQKRNLKILVSFLVVSNVLASAAAAIANDFHSRKTVRFIVGFAAGGGYDTYTRAIARHIGKHIPGNPSTVVENMDGAGSMIAANTIYRNSDPDGLTVGVFNSALVLRQALGDRAVRFDSKKFGWIGTPSVGLPSCAVMGFTGLKSLDDIIASKRALKMGSTRPGATTDDLPRILNLTLGTKFEVISGYKGTGPIRIALQKREVDGVCFGWESMRTTGRHMLDAKGDDKLIPFITHSDSEEPEVKDLPRLEEVVKAKAGEDGLAILNAWLPQYDFQRPLSVPPNTPKDRLATLRKAFKATLEDPEFLSEAKKSQLLITYVSGEQIEKYVAKILATPAKAKEKLTFLVPGKKRES
jgi:tripartite-type tricarboxylate transporter receptor subunit TctC